jgi:hypothetical protein
MGDRHSFLAKLDILHKISGFRPHILGTYRRTATHFFLGRNTMALWLLSVIIAVIGVVQLLQGQVLLAIVLFVAAALIGPGGYSIFAGRRGTT